MVLALTVLFSVTFFALAVYSLSWTYALKTFNPLAFQKNWCIYMLLTLELCLRLIMGYCHATIEDPLTCTANIAVLQLLCTLVYAFAAQFAISRFSHSIVVLCAMLRTLLYVVLSLEVCFPTLLSENQEEISNMVLILIIAILGAQVLSKIVKVFFSLFFKEKV